VGRLAPRKNLVRLVEAYRLVTERQPAPPLVLAGGDSDYGARLRQWARELRVEERLLFAGSPPDGLLPALYRGATFFVYPSLYEGFGLPVLEAMASGTPVVTADAGGTAEVAGEAALLANPESVEDLAEAMGMLLGDQALCRSYAARGLARAREFTWERTATETVAVYRRAAGASPVGPAS
jgi:glycosyltransferase involved in cell wall biosynthesis